MQERTLDFDCLVRVVQKAWRVALVELTNVRFSLHWFRRLYELIFCVAPHDFDFEQIANLLWGEQITIG